MQYFWKAPTEKQQERNSSTNRSTWAFGSDILRQGVFVISNETLGRSYSRCEVTLWMIQTYTKKIKKESHNGPYLPSSSLIVQISTSDSTFFLAFFGFPQESCVRSVAKVSLASARATQFLRKIATNGRCQGVAWRPLARMPMDSHIYSTKIGSQMTKVQKMKT